MKRVLVLCDDLWHPAEVIEKGFALMEGDAVSYTQLDVYKIQVLIWGRCDRRIERKSY